MDKKKPRVTVQEAKANAAAVRALWQAGRDSLDRLPADSSALEYGRAGDTIEKEARRLGYNIDWIGKARRIAEQYTHRDISDLCSLIVEHRSRFSATHFVVAIRCNKRKKRDALVQRAVKQSWSVSILKVAVQGQRGERREWVGRKPHVPRDVAEQLIILDANAERFSRFAVAVSPALPDDLRTVVVAALRAIGRVQDVAKKHLDDLGDKRG